MKTLFPCAAAALAAAAIACSSGADNRSNISSDRAGGATTSPPGQTTLVGCLETGERAGAYRLRVTRDTTDRAGRNAPTAGTSGQPDRDSSASTGLGGDAIRNSPTIGGGSAARTYDLVPADAQVTDVDRHVGAQVSVIGVIEDSATAARAGDPATRQAHTIRASSVSRVADQCVRP